MRTPFAKPKPVYNPTPYTRGWRRLLKQTFNDEVRWEIDTTSVGRSACCHDKHGRYWQVDLWADKLPLSDLRAIYENALRSPGAAEDLKQCFRGGSQDPWVMERIEEALVGVAP